MTKNSTALITCNEKKLLKGNRYDVGVREKGAFWERKAAMKISGFSFACNAESLGYPVVESVRSVLPLCDEFIMAVGKGSDRTRDLISAINDPKIRIIDTVWPDKKESSDHIFRQQANLALCECSGDWCLHIQCDEVVHEDDLAHIRKRCSELAGDKNVEAMLFNWIHFWGDYDHYQVNHRFFKRDIRIVRNRIGAQSYLDSQSFRKNGKKLRAVQLDARIFHYNMVRPPHLMRTKQIAMEKMYSDKNEVDKRYNGAPHDFDYGPLAGLPRYKGTHPAVMAQKIADFNWVNKLDYEGKSKARFHHDRAKYKILTFLEQRLLGGRTIGGFKNYTLVKR
jgi:hypothetical protein